MSTTIFNEVVERINADRFENLLRSYHMPISGVKGIVVKRILESIDNGNQNGLTEEKFDQFIAEEICHGRSRTLFVASLVSDSVKKLIDEDFSRDLLIQGGLGEKNFNELRAPINPDSEWRVYYANLSTQKKVVEKIDLCFARGYYIDVKVQTFEGEKIQERLRADYVWVTILPQEEKMIIKLWDRSGHQTEAMATMRKLFDELSEIVQGIFGIKVYKANSSFKAIIYKIFKDLTETAEKPFKNKVDQSKDLIREFSEQCVKRLGLPNSLDPIDLPYRIFRLLERALIQHKFEDYKSFFVGKIGVVDRVSFSDQTGAYVNARSGEDGMAVADIYFDTRDTIEELKLLDKIWVTWFQMIDGQPKPREIETRIEVYNDYHVIHFRYGYTTKEVENLVFSHIKRYEEIPD